MDKFTSYVEIQAEKAENLSFCSGIKLLHIRNSVEELLGYIGSCGFFEQYTIHSIKHIDEMLKIVEWLIPDSTKEKMTKAEWLMLTLAVYFHDLGMVITKSEYNERNKTTFAEFKTKILDSEEIPLEYKEYAKTNDDTFLYQEFVRENHAKRIRLWIEQKDIIDFGDNSDVKNILNEILSNLDNKFKMDLGMICESHHKDDIDDLTKYKVNSLYGNSDDEKVNLNYVAIILRIADLLHITKDRTPSITRQLINVTNPISVIEWEKQKAVRAVKPQSKRNNDNVIDDSLEKDTVEITAYFEGAETAEAYFGLSAYLQYAKKEILKCNEIITKSQKSEGTNEYKFPWNNIDDSAITAVGFETKKLQFTIAQENILQLLVGHTLYNDSSVVVRELVQNAIDAIKLQKCTDKKNNMSITDGVIFVNWNEDKRELSFIDNGTGMTIYDIENYLLKVGSSKYKEKSIKKDFPNFNSISHFGIGILTCFMIANDVDIITNSQEDEEANLINLRRVNGSYLLRKLNKSDLDDRILKHGTIVKLHVRNDVDMSTLEADLKKWIVLPEIPIWLQENEKSQIRIGFDSLKDVLVNYLNNIGCIVDGEKYDVYEKKHGNITIAYAIRHLKYLSDWCLMEFDRRRSYKEIVNPIGTCIEGIRVEFTTPGYKSSSILAIANIKDSNYQTNVARSAIELDANKKILSDIYDVYAEYVSEQMEGLEKENYSKTWALSEGKYLMKPLIMDNDSHNEPVDENILIQRLAKLKCFVIENGKERKVLSAEDVINLNEINIFECKMTQAAEYLLKEIKSNATLNDLIGVVCNENNFLSDNNNIICNYDEYNILHQYALRNKEVRKIKINRMQRIIHSTYSDNEDTWYKFRLSGNTFEKWLYVPKKDFIIEGLGDDIGVKTFGSIYISSDSELYKYIIKTIEIFLLENNEESKLLLEVFFSSIFVSNILEKVYKDNLSSDRMIKVIEDSSHLRYGDELMSKMWSKIDMNEFAKIVLSQNHSIYSINNWSRSGKDV